VNVVILARNNGECFVPRRDIFNVCPFDSLPEAQIYDPSFSGSTNQTADYIRGLQAQSQVDKGYIKPQVVHVSIVKEAYMNDDQFGLMMAVPDVVSGCFKLTPLEYEANFIDPYFLDIKVKRYRRVAPEGATKVAQCDRQNRQSTAMMVLSKKDLQERGTKQIRFSAEAGSDNFKINLSDSSLELVPESMVVFKAQGLGGSLKDRIVHTFTGGNVIALHVPMANANDDAKYQLIRFAGMHALSPTGDTPTTGNNSNVLYFYDQTGSMTNQIGPDGYGEVGIITVSRPYDGPNGRVWTPVNLSVFVTRPGTQL
jgi:hypothetical protein